VAAVGYDLYVQLVAEAVADAKGFVVPDVVQVNLDVPGEAHLPKNYVEADDARLEAYRRLVGVATMEELHDLRDEWLDRYGPLPVPAKGLLELGELRLECIELGVTSVVVLPARVGIRTKPVVKVTPLELSLSQQMRVRRTLGSRVYDEGTKELRVEVSNEGATPRALLDMLRSLVAVAEEANA
jgi:transcription-repair coupling factor (superfamily II helicase)